jgi:hypothetical protein
VSRRRYVYYRVPQAQVADVVAALQALQAQATTGFEVLRRPEASDGLATLMEVYSEAAPDGIEARAAAAVAPWLQGERHFEVFERLL